QDTTEGVACAGDVAGGGAEAQLGQTSCDDEAIASPAEAVVEQWITARRDGQLLVANEPIDELAARALCRITRREEDSCGVDALPTGDGDREISIKRSLRRFDLADGPRDLPRFDRGV